MSDDQERVRVAREVLREGLEGFAFGLETAASGLRELVSVLVERARPSLEQVEEALSQIPAEDVEAMAAAVAAEEAEVLEEAGGGAVSLEQEPLEPASPVASPDQGLPVASVESVTLVEAPLPGEVVRRCATCGGPLVRRRFPSGAMETPQQFGARRYCDRVCAGQARRGHVDDGRACAACGKPLERRLEESPAKFRERRYCDISCAGVAKRRQPEAAEPAPVLPVARAPRPVVRSRELQPLPRLAPGERAPLPDPRPTRGGLEVGPPTPIEGTANVNGRAFDATICEQHGVQRGFYGCPACNASAARHAAERSRPITPRAEGGR